MTERITKAREAVLAVIQRYAPTHARFSSEASRRLTAALDEHHNAVVEATLAGMPKLPEAPAADPKATSVVPLVAHDPNRQPDAVSDDPEPHDPVKLPSVADQAAGKPVKPAKPTSSGKVNKPPQ